MANEIYKYIFLYVPLYKYDTFSVNNMFIVFNTQRLFIKLNDISICNEKKFLRKPNVFLNVIYTIELAKST